MLANLDLLTTLTWCFMLISLYGAYLNVQKNRWGFLLWSFSNSFWMCWNFYIGEYAQAVLFGCFLYLAIQGLMTWNEERAKKTS